MAVAIGPQTAIMQALKLPELVNTDWRPLTGSVKRVVNRAPALIPSWRVAALATTLAGGTVRESLVI